MIDWLISSGRASVVSAAVALILGFVAGGWLLGGMLDHTPADLLTLPKLVGAAAGLLVGSAVAGTVFGVIAAIFDMQQSLRILSNRQRNDRSAEDSHDTLAYRPHHREPTLD